MFIHLGNDNVIQSKQIVSIVDQSLIAMSADMEEMIKNARKKGKVLGTADDAKSIVITEDTIYYSSLAVPTLQKRASMISTISKLEDYSDELE